MHFLHVFLLALHSFLHAWSVHAFLHCLYFFAHGPPLPVDLGGGGLGDGGLGDGGGGLGDGGAGLAAGGGCVGGEGGGGRPVIVGAVSVEPLRSALERFLTPAKVISAYWPWSLAVSSEPLRSAWLRLAYSKLILLS